MSTRKGITTSYAGWLISALLAGVMLGSGFQDTKEKFGMVDLRQVILSSKISKETQTKVEAARSARLAVLNFILQQRVITVSQAGRLRELELKDTKTDAEKTELDSLKSSVIAAAKEYDRLSQLTNPTEAERQQLMEYTKLYQAAPDVVASFQSDFETDFGKLAQDAQDDAIARAATAAKTVAKAKGYTIVFSSSAVVYAANDITADAIKEAEK